MSGQTSTCWAVCCTRSSSAVPRIGETTSQIIRSVVCSAPEFEGEGSAQAPVELMDLCKGAMAAEPTDRPASADAFQASIRDYLRHRTSVGIEQASEVRLAEMRRAIEDLPAGRRGENDPLAAAAVARVHDLFGESRFGFRQAIETCPHHHSGRDGLRRALVAMAEFELSQDNPRAAARLLEEITDPPADLADQVARATASSDASQSRLEELEASRAEQAKPTESPPASRGLLAPILVTVGLSSVAATILGLGVAAQDLLAGPTRWLVVSVLLASNVWLVAESLKLFRRPPH